MKIFTSKSFTNKFIISIVCVILLNFCITPAVRAETSFGGKMMSIMRDFVTAVADVAASLVQLGVTGEWSYAVDEEGSGTPSKPDEYWIDQEKFRYPILQISPEVIFANQVELLDANFISPVNDKDYAINLKNDAPLKQLRNIIAGWYVTLRTIAVVGLLSVLIYIGIRIIISSTSGDKAKYKQRLMDWVVAFCLLFFMHYIMAGVVTIVEKANDMLNATAGGTQGLDLVEKYGGVSYSGSQETNFVGNGQGGNNQGVVGSTARNDSEAIQEAISKVGSDPTSRSSDWEMISSESTGRGGIVTYQYKMEFDGASVVLTKTDTQQPSTQPGGEIAHNIVYSYQITRTSTSQNGNQGGTQEVANSEGLDIKYIDGDQILYFTNYARLYLNVADDDDYLPMSTAYLIIYIALVAFTAVFTMRYIKRVIYIAFLTLMAPMVALTYPLDKIKDRKSTGMEYVV